MSAARPDRAALIVAFAIAAAIFTISFGFVADADRGTSTAAAPRAPGKQPASPRAARGERVTLDAAPGLRVRASLLGGPVRRARARRVAPTPSPAASVPSAASTKLPVQPVDPSAPVAPAPSAPVAPAPSSTTPSPAPAPAPAPVAPKPRPKPAAKPKPPKPPDFDNTGPPAPVKQPPGSG